MLRFAVTLLLLGCAALPGETRTRNVILVTADGLRWQDLFSGIDPTLMKEKAAGIARAAALRERLRKETPEARRAALMPFFWATLAPRGVVFGNVRRGSSASVTNAYRISFPGYSEILTGRAQDDAIRNNDPVRNPTPSVLEFLRAKLGLAKPQAALFASWSALNSRIAGTAGQFNCNVAPIGRFGNAGTGILLGPGTFNLSMGLGKEFSITERSRLRLEGTFTNLPNHPNLADPGTNVTAVTFGVITAARGGDSGGNRVGQVSLRFEF